MSVNIIEEYKNLLEITKQDSQRFIQIIMNLNDVIVSLKDTIKNLQEDNENLRTQLSLANNRLFENHFNVEIHEQYNNDETVPAQIEPEVLGVEEPPHAIRVEHIYSIPPHIRREYIRNLPENQVCAICLANVENNDTMELTECGHIFHIACINRHRSNNNNCPVCRREI